MRLGLPERIAIEAGIYRRDSLEKIAKDIGISRRAVSEEIRRNRTLPLLQDTTERIVGLQRNVFNSLYVKMFTVVFHAYYAGKLIALPFAPLMPQLPAYLLTGLPMFVTFARAEEVVRPTEPITLPRRPMLWQ